MHIAAKISGTRKGGKEIRAGMKTSDALFTVEKIEDKEASSKKRKNQERGLELKSNSWSGFLFRFENKGRDIS
jgi:hypothetical protein